MTLRLAAKRLWVWYRASYTQYVVVACAMLALFWVGWVATGHTVPIWRTLPLDIDLAMGHTPPQWTMPIASSGWWFAFAPIAIFAVLEPVIRWRATFSVTDFSDDGCAAAHVCISIIGAFCSVFSYEFAYGCVACHALCAVVFCLLAFDRNLQINWGEVRDVELLIACLGVSGFLAGPTQGLISLAASIASGAVIGAVMALVIFIRSGFKQPHLLFAI